MTLWWVFAVTIPVSLGIGFIIGCIFMAKVTWDGEIYDDEEYAAACGVLGEWPPGEKKGFET